VHKLFQLLISSRSPDFRNFHRVELLLCWRWCKREYLAWPIPISQVGEGIKTYPLLVTTVGLALIFYLTMEDGIKESLP